MNFAHFVVPLPRRNINIETIMTIAVDFDGTIVEHRYPEIGKELPFATQTLRMLIEQRHKLILWTVREGQLLEDAVEWCRKRGVEFYAINKVCKLRMQPI